MLNVETICALRLSEIWKSSFFKPVTALPWPSRTTTRTKTKLTRTLNVAGLSRVDTSAALLASDGVAVGGGCAGACEVVALFAGGS